MRADYTYEILGALLRLHNWKQLGNQLGFTNIHLADIEIKFSKVDDIDSRLSLYKKELIWNWLKCEGCTKQSLMCALKRMGTEFESTYECLEQLVI